MCEQRFEERVPTGSTRCIRDDHQFAMLGKVFVVGSVFLQAHCPCEDHQLVVSVARDQ